MRKSGQGKQTVTHMANGIGDHSQGTDTISSAIREEQSSSGGTALHSTPNPEIMGVVPNNSTETTQASTTLDDDFVLAVHVRHMQARDSGEKDTRGELKCISEMLSLHVDGFRGLEMSSTKKAKEDEDISYPCTVLLASDRHATLNRLTRDIRALGCTVIIANHEEDYTDAEFKTYSRVQNRTITRVSGGRNKGRRLQGGKK